MELIEYYAGYVFGALFAVLVIAAVVLVIAKMRRKESITITPVGIANDLPDSVTGMNKYADALNVDDKIDDEEWDENNDSGHYDKAILRAENAV